jgi:hypothetical protein
LAHLSGITLATAREVEKMKETLEDVPEYTREDGKKAKEERHGEDSIPLERTETVLLDAGFYEAEYFGAEKRLNQKSEVYLSHKWKVDDSGKEKNLYESSSLVVSDKSKMFEIITALDALPAVGNRIDLKSLVGKRCRLMVDVISDNNMKKNKIKGHAPLKK